MEKKFKIVLLTVLTLSALTIAIIEISLAWRRDRRDAEVSLYDRATNRSYHGEIHPDQVKSRDEMVHEMKKTSMQFYETWYNGGSVYRGETVRHSFMFKNTGDNPLMIAKADVSCGCTVTKFPEDAIAPGQNGEITVELNTGGIPDSTVSSHESPVVVHANTNPEAMTITLYVDINRR